MITAIDKNTALVLIDLQKGIVGRPAAHPIETIIQNAAHLVDAFHAAGLPVVAVNVNPIGAAWTKLRVEKPSAPQGAIAQAAAKAVMGITDFTGLVPELKTRPGDIFVTKHTWNAFFETPLHAELQKRGVTQIVLGGVSTSIGVEGTARAASELGYNIAFATDAMTDTLATAHEHSLQAIFPRIGELGATAEIIAKLGARE